MALGEYNFKIIHKSRTGVIKNAAVVDFLQLTYSMPVNEAGRADIVLPANHPMAVSAEEFDQVEIWWRNKSYGVDWQRDFTGISRDIKEETDTSGISQITMICPQDKSMLGWRNIAYRAGVANLSTFSSTPAETIMKTLVEYNAGASAIIGNGRLLIGDLSAMGYQVTTAADLGRGASLDISVSHENLLAALSDALSNTVSGGDWDLNKTSTNSWEFEFYPSQRGDDKTTGANAIEFSLARGNLLRPSLHKSRLQNSTVVIVGGQARGDQRNYQIVLGTDYSADNHIESFLNYSNSNDANELITAGTARADELRAKEIFDFEVLQDEYTFYSKVAVAGRKTYREGDLVSVRYGVDGVTRTRKITNVEVNFRPPSGAGSGQVQINIDTEDV